MTAAKANNGGAWRRKATDKIASEIARLVIREGLANIHSSRASIQFDDPVQAERFDKLLDEWLEAATE